MLSCFNEHFIASGFLFESLNSTNFNANFNATFNYFNSFTDGQNQHGPSFSFYPILVSDVHKALRLLDTTKAAGPDKLEPYFLKIASDFIASPLTHIFNLS